MGKPRRVSGDTYVSTVSTARGSQALSFERRLTTDNATDTNPSWSRDGRWLYFSSNRTGTFEIWKMPSTGGEARQLTRGGGATAHEAADGRWIYFTNRRPFGNLWRMPADGGD